MSVVIPCLNEAENIESCVKAALGAIERMGVPGEVVVADNNSEDDSARLAQEAGARVVIERRRGYGSAYLAGFAASTGRYIVMADEVSGRTGLMPMTTMFSPCAASPMPCSMVAR